MEIKEYLIYLHTHCGISYKKIAENINYNAKYISDILNDRANAGKKFIEALYKAYPREEK